MYYVLCTTYHALPKGLGGFYSLLFFHCTILFLQFDVPCLNDRDVPKKNSIARNYFQIKSCGTSDKKLTFVPSPNTQSCIKGAYGGTGFLFLGCLGQYWKKFWADYEQLLRAMFFSCFQGQIFFTFFWIL